jgi:hypothetical protein
MGMPTKWVDKFVKCPFYRKTDTNRIACEGFSKGNTINLVYESQADKKQYMKERCESIEGCRRCPIYSLLERMYNE